MASNVDFASAAYDPAKIFGQGDDYVNRLYQYAAKRDAGALYAQGDTAGAARRLATSGDIAGASKLQGDEEDRQFARIKNSHDYMKQAAPVLAASYAKDPQQVLTDFEQLVPEWKQVGATDAGVQTLRKALQNNPQGTLTALMGSDLQFEKTDEGIVAIDKRTGKQVGDTIKTGGESGGPFKGNNVDAQALNILHKGPGTPGYEEARIYLGRTQNQLGQGVLIQTPRFNLPPDGTSPAGAQPQSSPGPVGGRAQGLPGRTGLPPGAAPAGGPFVDSKNVVFNTDPDTHKSTLPDGTPYTPEGASRPSTDADRAGGSPRVSTRGPGGSTITPLPQRATAGNDVLLTDTDGTLYWADPRTHAFTDASGQPYTPKGAQRLGTAPNATTGPTGKTKAERDRNILLSGDPASAEYAAAYASAAAPRISYDPQTGDQISVTPDMSWARPPTFKGAAAAAGAPDAPGAARGASTGQPTVTAEPGRAASPARATFEANVNQATDDTDLAISRFFKGGPKGQEEKGVFQRSIAASGSIPLTNGRTASQAIRRAVEVLLRLRTGAAAPEQEVDRYTYDFSPSIFDTDEGARIKMQRMRTFFADMRRIGESNIRAGTWGTDKASLTGANTGGADVAPAGGKPKFIIEKVE